MKVVLAPEDNYGQKHPIESPELIQAKLQELMQEMGKLEDEEDKKNWKDAQVKCPALTDDDHKLMFLRCEVFDAQLAAVRMGKYWTKRVSLFGPEKAFLPLHQDVALKDDMETMKLGFCRRIPGTDPVGRGILFIDPSRQDKKVYKTYDSFVRYIWYMIHSVLMDLPSAQQKGFVMLVFPKNAKFTQFDRHLDRHILESLQGILPIRMSSMQICNPPSFISIILPIIKLLMGERLRKRIKIHTGKDIIGKLEKYGIHKEIVPTELGGELKLDHDAWLEQRRKGEQES